MQNLRRVSTSSVDSYTFCYHFALNPWIVQNYFIPLRCSFLVVPEAIQTIRCFFAHKRTHHTHPICKNLRSHNSISQLSTHCVDIIWNDRLTHLRNSSDIFHQTSSIFKVAPEAIQTIRCFCL